MGKHDKKDWSKFKEEHQSEDLLNEDELTDEMEGEAASEHAENADLEAELTAARQEALKYKDESMRALAEMENLRRRMEREVANAHKYGMEKLLVALLPVVDSLEQGLQLADKSADVAMHEGMELTMKLLLDVLKKFDVHQLDPLGENFDPQQHEAMAMQDAPDAAPNSIIAVFQKGYKLHDRVIRPARVVIAKK